MADNKQMQTMSQDDYWRLVLNNYTDDSGSLPIGDAERLENLNKFINQQVVAALEEVKSKAYTEKTMPPRTLIPVSAVDDVMKGYL